MADFLWQCWVWLDGLLIAPYRWPDNAVLGWWLGTGLLALWSALLGKLTLATVYAVNKKHVRETTDEVKKMHDASMNALKSGEKQAWKDINKLGNEAVGKAFFLNIAMGAGALWPAFFAAAWLRPRFEGVMIPSGLGSVNYAAGFIICYISTRILISSFKRLAKRKKPPVDKGTGGTSSRGRFPDKITDNRN